MSGLGLEPERFGRILVKKSFPSAARFPFPIAVLLRPILQRWCQLLPDVHLSKILAWRSPVSSFGHLQKGLL